MTVDEIKAQNSMRDIVERYGIKVKRDGMCCCPIHGEKRPSMKVYKDSFHCFACGANGDIFTFIQELDKCDFKTAFQSLGGDYGEHDKKSQIALYKAKKALITKRKKEQSLKEKIRKNTEVIHKMREAFNSAVPDSDEFWTALEAYHSAIIRDINLREDG